MWWDHYFTTLSSYGANTIYKGIAVGGRYDVKGSASNLMCLPNAAMHYTDGAMGDQAGAYAVEYHASGAINHAYCHNMPCSL